MGINTFEQVWNNALALIVIFIVFFWIYRNMPDTPFKRWVSDKIGKMKGVIKDGQE